MVGSEKIPEKTATKKICFSFKKKKKVVVSFCGHSEITDVVEVSQKKRCYIS